DAAHDQHVVGAADTAHAQRCSPAGAGRGPQARMVAAAKAQKRRRFAREMGIDELAGGAIAQFERFARVRIDELDVDQSVRGEMHARLLRALAPERGSDVADAHDLVDLGAPGTLELATEARFAAAGLAADDDALHR